MLTETERREKLIKLGLEPDGPALTPLRPQPVMDTPAPSSTNVYRETGQIPDLEALTDEELLDGEAFERYKLEASKVTRAVSSPHNKALQARINQARARRRGAQQEARRERKAASTGYVREQARESVATAATEAVLKVLAEMGLTPERIRDLTRQETS